MRYQYANKCPDSFVRLLTLPILYNTNDFNIWVGKIFLDLNHKVPIKYFKNFKNIFFWWFSSMLQLSEMYIIYKWMHSSKRFMKKKCQSNHSLWRHNRQLTEWLLDFSVIAEMAWSYHQRAPQPEIENYCPLHTSNETTQKRITYTFNHYCFSKLSFKDKENKKIIYVYSSVKHKKYN